MTPEQFQFLERADRMKYLAKLLNMCAFYLEFSENDYLCYWNEYQKLKDLI